MRARVRLYCGVTFVAAFGLLMAAYLARGAIRDTDQFPQTEQSRVHRSLAAASQATATAQIVGYLTDRPPSHSEIVQAELPGLSDAQYEFPPRLVMPAAIYQTSIVRVEDRAALDRLLQQHPIQLAGDFGNGIYVVERITAADADDEGPAR